MNTLDQIIQVATAAKNKKPIRYRRWWPEAEETWHPGVTENPLFNFAKYEFELAPEPVPPGDLTWEDVRELSIAGTPTQYYGSDGKWHDEMVGDYPRNRTLAYRRKPAPRMVPLGPEDVTPGSAVRKQGWEKNTWDMVTSVGIGSLERGHGGEMLSYDEMQRNGWEISHDGGSTRARAEKPEVAS